MSDPQERKQSKCQHKFLATNCKKCGIYNHPQNPAIKTNHYDSFLNCSASKYVKHMRKRKCQIIQGKDIHEATWNLLQSICQKFQYSLQTLALGLYIFAKTYHRQQKDEKFWASASLLVASKAIQLDKRVPYINRFQKYAQKNYSQQEYEGAEKSILQQMQFNVQFSTFMSFLYFYITNGILFRSDNLSQFDIKRIQDDTIVKAKQYMKNGSFLSQNPQKLALHLIKQIRNQNKLQPWTKQLETLTQLKNEQICIVQKNNILKPICLLSTKAKEKLNNFSSFHNNIMTLQSSSQIIDHKPKLIRRRNDSSMKHNVKQNSFRPQPLAHQAFLSNIRNQTFSVSKHQSASLSINSNLASSEKLIPLFGYQHHRF